MELGTLFNFAILLFCGLIFAKIIRYFKLPDVTGYLIGGLIIGPSVLGLLSADAVAGLSLVSDVALGFIAFSLLGQGGAAVRGAARYYLVFSLVLAAALVLGLYPLMRRAQEKPRYMGYVLAAMLVVSGAFVVFVEAYGFSADTDAENLASGIGNAWKMLGAVAGMTLAWLLDRRYIHFETQAVWWVQVIKVAVGMALLLAIKSGLKAPLLALLGHEGLAGGVRYFLLVLVAGAVWPLVFRPMSKWGKGKK